MCCVAIAGLACSHTVTVDPPRAPQPRTPEAQPQGATVDAAEAEHPLDRLVAQVILAADARDLESLRALMPADFSTLDDSGPRAAIAVIAEDRSRHLDNLVALLQGDCAFVDRPDHWMCPRQLAESTTTEYGNALRTHFALEDGTWRWVAYVVDDGTALTPRIVDPVLPSSSPQITSPPSSMEERDPDVVRVIVRQHIHEVRACYNEGLKRDGSLRGRVTIQFTIDPRGSVAKSIVLTEKTSLPDAQTARCVADAAKRWKFPQPTDGRNVVITYPFVLEPG
jgi:TonB family protein